MPLELKRVPVDLWELELAMSSPPEAESWLDTETGEIHSLDFDMDPEEREEIADRIEDAPIDRYVRIDRIESWEEYDDMVEFTETVEDERLRKKLEVALNGRGAFRRFKDVLLNYPKERERWFAFKDKRTKERMLEWLAENGLAPTDEKESKQTPSA